MDEVLLEVWYSGRVDEPGVVEAGYLATKALAYHSVDDWAILFVRPNGVVGVEYAEVDKNRNRISAIADRRKELEGVGYLIVAELSGWSPAPVAKGYEDCALHLLSNEARRRSAMVLADVFPHVLDRARRMSDESEAV